MHYLDGCGVNMAIFVVLFLQVFVFTPPNKDRFRGIGIWVGFFVYLFLFFHSWQIFGL